MKTSIERLAEPEMIEILEDLARNSQSATARIQAIKTLRAIHGREEPEESDSVMDAPARRTSHLRAA
jgi:hypothetical protein